MLVLSRHVGEVIVINENITVTVVRIENGKVRLGVHADPSIPVHRGEVWEQIREVRKPEAS